jgi:hypothetical protein
MLTLNNDHVLELSRLTAEQLRHLCKVAWRVRVSDDLAAMLIAFDQDTPYDSQNLNWFRARYRRFAYIDRVVVAPAARGRGLARRLYEDVITAARAEGHTLLCAEVNLDPPNPPSDALHAATGFTPVGEAELVARGKAVRYFVRQLD